MSLNPKALLAVSLLVIVGGSHHPRAEHPQDAASTAADHREFMSANEVAMDRMMAGMTIRASGDVDRDFVAMMVPHHQGAIDMAVAELRYGRNEQLRRLAQEIIVSQQQEIAAMRLAVGQPLPPSTPAPTTPHRHHASEGAER